ncbi:MAG: hypothetical protein FWD46_04085 [Cystobacterineae bacterium]|nr:hypothetical protein [Cystobacterineae bacterium]
MKFNLRLRSLFLQAQELIGDGVFSLKTRSELLAVLEEHAGSWESDKQEVPVDRGFFMIGSSDGEPKSKA